MAEQIPWVTRSVAISLWLSGSPAATAGFYYPGPVPWPGGIVPYTFEVEVSTEAKRFYLAGLREYELAANVEFIAGTNPNESTSRLFAEGEISGRNFSLVFQGKSGRIYRIERSASLAGIWSPVAVNIAGGGGDIVLAVPVDPSAPREFFRVLAGSD